MFDTHCHLDAHEFDADRDVVVAAAAAGGIDRLLVPAVSVANFAAVQACCERYPACMPAYGIHPLYVDSAREEDLETLSHWLRREAQGAHPPIAVGEIGLDFFAPNIDVERQEYYFREQLRFAAAADLPVVLHVRRAVDAVLKHLRRENVCGGIAHAFNGSRQQADAYFRLGFCLGFGGAMTYPGSSRIRGLAATLPLDAIVLETDAPDMVPAWLAGTLKGARNSPAQLGQIARVLADLRGEPVEKIVEITTRNALRCLALKSC